MLNNLSLKDDSISNVNNESSIKIFKSQNINKKLMMNQSTKLKNTIIGKEVIYPEIYSIEKASEILRPLWQFHKTNSTRRNAKLVFVHIF